MPKLDPAPLTFNIPLPAVDPSNTTKYLDLSQISSILNRRFYRQGLQWAVQGFTLHTYASAGVMDIAKIPQTWPVAQGWKKAMDAWNKQQMHAVEAAGADTAVARFRDFKIFADPLHVSNGYGDNLLPGIKSPVPGIEWELAAPGMWEPSEIVLPNTIAQGGSFVEPSERYLHMVGVNVNGSISRGIIEGYADSRAFPQSPDPVSPDIASSQNWMARMFDVGNDINETLENATEHNDELPYQQVDYPGGSVQLRGMDFHDSINITSTTVGGKSTAKGGVFPCGLIRLKYSTTLGATEAGYLSVLQVHLVPGNSRGYMTESMLEM